VPSWALADQPERGAPPPLPGRGAVPLVGPYPADLVEDPTTRRPARQARAAGRVRVAEAARAQLVVHGAPAQVRARAGAGAGSSSHVDSGGGRRTQNRPVLGAGGGVARLGQRERHGAGPAGPSAMIAAAWATVSSGSAARSGRTVCGPHNQRRQPRLGSRPVVGWGSARGRLGARWGSAGARPRGRPAVGVVGGAVVARSRPGRRGGATGPVRAHVLRLPHRSARTKRREPGRGGVHEQEGTVGCGAFLMRGPAGPVSSDTQSPATSDSAAATGSSVSQSTCPRDAAGTRPGAGRGVHLRRRHRG